MDKLETIEYNGYNINIYRDYDVPDPRKEFDNLGNMSYYGRHTYLGDKEHALDGHYYEERDINEYLLETVLNFDGGDLLGMWDEQIQRQIDKHFIILRELPQINKDVSGVTWVLKKDIYKEYGCKRISKKLREKVLNVLRSELHVYNQYLNDEVFGYMIEKEDSLKGVFGGCWGFYGDDWETNGLLEAAKGEIDVEIDEQLQYVQSL